MDTYVIIIINKFFYVEILLEKATYSGHMHLHHHDQYAWGVVVFCEGAVSGQVDRLTKRVHW